ncbi:MAG: hypothetical protein CBD21_01400 [bacterium TMED161]|nr:hypothetical protein [Candidatus Neomarinimicrobiota bacterium]OUW21295.1 MAG: hypothetical protein CBD21_01400 [bacterium TMED161]|tara:strand:+ start:5457 stop:5969 length:513 start_codon:yes stop_codon:yes gene_type:complete
MKHDYNLFKNYLIFDGLSEQEIENFIKLMTFKKVKKNEVIIKEGDNGDTIILLLNGEVSMTQALTLKNSKAISDNREKTSIRIDSKKSHHFFGEISLFNEVDKRTATITATSDCEIAILDDNEIIKLCNENHTLGYKIMKNLAEKLASSLERTNSQVLKLTTVFSLILEN